MNTVIGYRQIWKISYPIILVLLAENVINLTDTIFLGRVGETELGASAIGGIFYLILFITGLGFSIGTQIIVSQRNGEKRYSEIGPIVTHSMLALVVMSVAVMILVRIFFPVIIGNILSSPKVVAATVEYMNFRVWGLGFVCVSLIIRAFLTGIYQTRYLTYSAVIVAGVNVVLSWLLIFGKFGFPRMGIAGAGLASATAEGISMIYLLIISLKVKKFAVYQLYRKAGKGLSTLREVFRMSVYIVFQHFFSMTAWFTFFLIIERMGEHELAISNIIRNIYTFLMLPIWGVCAAAQTMTGNLIGEKRKHEIFGALGKSARLSLAITFLISLPIALFPEAALGAFTNNYSLVTDSRNVLYIVLGALQGFAIAWVYYSGISGTGDTKKAMWIETFSLLVYLGGLYVMTALLNQPIEVAWCSEYVYFGIFGLLSIFYWRNWKKKHLAVKP